MNADQWHSSGAYITVNGHRHFYYDSQNNLPVLLILHGYPTCSYDYHKVLPYLEQHFRLIVHDHLGFGFSDKPVNYSYSLIEQADQALLLWQQLGIENAVILAHDYGTSVATEILARMNMFDYLNIEVKRMVLCNGSIHIELSKLRLIQKLLVNRWIGPWIARLSSRRVFAKNLKNIYHDPDKLTTEEITALWSMLIHNDGRKVLPQVTQYLKQRYKFWHRWVGALSQTALPVDIIWAKDDPVAVVAIAHKLAEEIKNHHLIELDQLGHYPMLENPELWSEAVINNIKNKA